MPSEIKTAYLGKFPLESVPSIFFWIAPVGIAGAEFAGLVFLLQIGRFVCGIADPFAFAAEMISWSTVIVLIWLLRAALVRPAAPSGFGRKVLDFFALSRWHPAVIAALIGLLVLPAVWFLRSDRQLLFLLSILGWKARASGDFQDSLDRLTVAYQLSLTGGVPLLFGLHMLSRWQPKRKALVWVLVWLLVPILFVGTAVEVVVLVTLMH